MAPRSLLAPQFAAHCQSEELQLLAEFPTLDAARAFLTAPAPAWANAPATQLLIAVLLREAAATEAAIRPGQLTVSVHHRPRRGVLAVHNPKNQSVLVWTFDAAPGGPEGCLQLLADLAKRGRGKCELDFVAQEDLSFMWRGSLVHPMQVRENVYQRVVHAVDRDPTVTDPLTARSEALGRYFQQGEAVASPLVGYRPEQDGVPARWASVRMNHLIDTFYLFRLLIRFQASAERGVSEDLRVGLSGSLTKYLHSGDQARMGWLSQWLAEKVADLGTRVMALNGGGKRKVIFFLKGGRALNYLLGTPERGENDWDTQVVIDPRLPAEEWYALFARVHDTMLEALEQYAGEFTDLLTANAPEFGAYLAEVEAALPADDEETENEAHDFVDHLGRASCKAELIDIGLPRRGTPAALEEWNHLSPPGAIMDRDGVLFPHRPYYVNEYLMMVREAFRTHADVTKVPKRITRLALLLGQPGADLAPARAQVAIVLPLLTAVIEADPSPARREVLMTSVAQLVQAYSLAQDKELAGCVDAWGQDKAGQAGELPAQFQPILTKLTPEENGLVRAVGFVEELSGLLQAHCEERSKLVHQHGEFFETLLHALHLEVKAKLPDDVQFAVVGAYAARKHAEQLRLGVDGLEPVRRVVVHLQHPAARPEAEALDLVRAEVLQVVQDVSAMERDAPVGLEPVGLGPAEQGRGRTLAFRWSTPIPFSAENLPSGSGPRYEYNPLMFKVRAAAQTGDAGALPVLASLNDLPVLDLRYLADDYLRKSAKTHEVGMQAILQKASQAVVNLMAQFEVQRVEVVDPDDE